MGLIKNLGIGQIFLSGLLVGLAIHSIFANNYYAIPLQIAGCIIGMYWGIQNVYKKA